MRKGYDVGLYTSYIVRVLALLSYDNNFLSTKFLELLENSLETSPYIYIVVKVLEEMFDKVVEK